MSDTVTQLPAPEDLFGAEVQYWRLDPACWRRVLERALEAGLPGISSYMPWELHEVEKGRFDLDGATDPRRNVVGYLDLVKELGLKLAFRPGPFVCNEMDWGGHPRRIVMGDVPWKVLQADGQAAPGYHIARKEGHQPSYLHPAYLDEVRLWLKAVDEVARNYTVENGGPIATCNLDNEVSYIVRDSMFGADYNPCVVGKGGLYHQWLRRKYGSPDRLPYAARFGAFESVEPPRELGSEMEKNLIWYFDWIEFKEWLLAEYLRVLRQMHMENGLTGVHFYANLNPHRPEGVPTNFKRFAEATGGLVGYDFYRNTWLKYSGYSSMARVLKVLEASVPLVWSAEFMSGTWKTDLTDSRVPQSHTEFMGLSALANGCKAINWFMFHDRDMWGDAPVSEMGHPRENLAALQRILGVVKGLPEWNSLRPVHDLAVAYYRPYMWHCHLGDPMPCADDKLHIGDPLLWGEKAGETAAEFEGAFRLLQQAGYTAGCVDLSDAPERLKGHRALWFVGSSFIEPETAALLARFVEDGGVLIVTRVWPRTDLQGGSLSFLERKAPASAEKPFVTWAAGKGRVAWLPGRLTPEVPGEEDIHVVQRAKAMLHSLIGPPFVDVTTPPVRWKTWKSGGGTTLQEEPHNFVEAVLHQGGGMQALFLVNLHDRSVWAQLKFRDVVTAHLAEVGGTGAQFSVVSGKAAVDVDRKSVRVFRLLMGPT